MSQCVPSWDLDDSPVTVRLSLRSNSNSNSNSTAPDVPMSDYEVAELTWENGKLAMHGLGPPRVPAKPALNSTTWDKPRVGGTLESIVNQATCFPVVHRKDGYSGDELVPWLDHHRAVAAVQPAASSATMTMDALVPCSNRSDDRTTTHVIESIPAAGLGVGCSTGVGSCSGPAGTAQDVDEVRARGGAAARVPVTPEWSMSKEQQSTSGCSSATFGREHGGGGVGGGGHHHHHQYDKEYLGMGFTSTTTLGSPENTSSATPTPRPYCTKPKPTTTDDHDSVCHSTPQREECDEEDKKKETGKSSVSTKRVRAAAIHNQSERKRRDKINQRMKTLQKLVPNSSKTDKASMLDEVIEYLKQLQAQVQMMSRMNMAPMMLPMTTMQQQLQLSMMAGQMGMGMGIGMGGMGVMDINTMRCPNITSISPHVLPNPFIPIASWDSTSGGDHRLQQAAASAAVMPDPLSTFLACQSQLMTMEAYTRMAAMYQQMQQPPASSSRG